MLLAMRLLTFVLQGGPAHLTQTLYAIGHLFFPVSLRDACQYFQVSAETLLQTGNEQFVIIPYPTAFPYGNGMVLHFYQQQESSTTKTVHKVINKGLKTYV